MGTVSASHLKMKCPIDPLASYDYSRKSAEVLPLPEEISGAKIEEIQRGES
jgi:hypothetical protein